MTELFQMSPTDLREWLFGVLHGHGIVSDSPRQEATPGYFLLNLYSASPRAFRDDFEAVLVQFLRELESDFLASWEKGALHQLLLISGTLLTASGKREEAITYLRRSLSSSPPEHERRFHILQALIGLKDRQTPEFWRDQYIMGGDGYAPLVVEGLALIDEVALFTWIRDVTWNSAVEAALAGILPSVLLEYGVGRTTAAITTVFASLSVSAKQGIRDLLTAEDISSEGLEEQAELRVAKLRATDEEIPSSLKSLGTRELHGWNPLAAVAEHPQYQSHVLARQIESYLLALLANNRFEPDLVRELFGSANRILNGHDRAEVAKLIGEFSGDLEAKRKISEDQVRTIAGAFFEIFSDGKSIAQLAQAHFVRSRTQKLADLEWRKNSNRVFDLLYGIKDISGPARAVKKLAVKHRIDKLLIAESEFHEDRIISKILKIVFDEVGLPLVTAARRWGNLETRSGQADIGLANHGGFDKPSGGSGAVYLYKGYYVFARRSWLESLYEWPELPPGAKLALSKLFGAEEYLSDEEYLLGRAWVAAAGGVSRLGEGFGFPEVMVLLKEKAESIAPITMVGHTPTQDQTFGQQLGAFLRGEIEVFMGGAIHARLLRRWWTPPVSNDVYELMSPNDFASLLGSKWPPYDELMFGERLTTLLKQRDYKDFSASILRLYRTVGSLAKTVVKTKDRNEKSAELLSYFSGVLAPSSEDSDGREWSFVSDPNDTALLLDEDNEFLA